MAGEEHPAPSLKLGCLGGGGQRKQDWAEPSPACLHALGRVCPAMISAFAWCTEGDAESPSGIWDLLPSFPDGSGSHPGPCCQNWPGL